MGLADFPARVKGRIDRDFVEPLRRRRRARQNVDRSFSAIFVTGAMGGGTTLLGFQLFQNFETAGVLDETCLMAPRGDLLSIDPISAHPRIADFEATLLPRNDWSEERAYAESQKLYRARCEPVDLPVVDKNANAHLFRTAFLARAFPGSAMVVIVRDPVANIEGFRRKWPTFGRDTLAENIRFYRDMHTRFLAERDGFEGRAVVLSYQGLVDDPKRTRAILAERLGLEEREELRPLPSRPNVLGQGARNVVGDRLKIMKGENERAFEKVAPGDAEQIRSGLDDLYARLLDIAENVK